MYTRFTGMIVEGDYPPDMPGLDVLQAQAITDPVRATPIALRVS
jgi:hypothetical protein